MKHTKMNPQTASPQFLRAKISFSGASALPKQKWCAFTEKGWVHRRRKNSFETKIKGCSEIFRFASCMLD